MILVDSFRVNPIMSKEKANNNLRPVDFPIWIIVENPRILGDMVTYEAEDIEPEIRLRVGGEGFLYKHAAIYDLSGGASHCLSVSISPGDYSAIKAKRRKFIEKDGDTGISLCSDIEATFAYIHHVEAEFSEVAGKLWDTNWALNIEVPETMFSQLIESLRFDSLGKIHLGVELKHLLHDKEEGHLSLEKPNLFIEAEKHPHGFMNSLTLLPAQTTENVLQKETGKWMFWGAALIFLIVAIGLSSI